MSNHDPEVEVDNAITWDTTCLNCARILDKSYADFVRAEQAEAALSRVLDDVERVADDLRAHHAHILSLPGVDDSESREAGKANGLRVAVLRLEALLGGHPKEGTQ